MLISQQPYAYVCVYVYTGRLSEKRRQRNKSVEIDNFIAQPIAHLLFYFYVNCK